MKKKKKKKLRIFRGWEVQTENQNIDDLYFL